MKDIFEEVRKSFFPRFYKLKGENGKYERFILKATRRGLQLIKADPAMLQLLGQN